MQKIIEIKDFSLPIRFLLCFFFAYAVWKLIVIVAVFVIWIAGLY